MKRLDYYDVSLYQMQLFLEVAKEGNFSKVSDKSNITQPALSKKMSTLEKTLGFPLFQRTSRPVRLTCEGKYLFSQWSELLHNFEISIETACEIHEQTEKSLIVGCLDSLAIKYSQAINKFFNQHPEISGHIEFCQFSVMKEMLMDDRLDLIFWPSGALNYFGQGVCQYELTTSPVLVCMLKNNALAGKKSIAIKDLKDQRFVLISPGEKGDSYIRVAEICGKEGFMPRIARYVPNAHSLILALRNNNEIVLCDHFLTGIENPGIQCVQLEGETSIMNAVWKQDNTNPFIHEFISEIKRELSK